MIQALFLNVIDHTHPVFRGHAAHEYMGFRFTDPNRDGQANNMDQLLLQAFFLGIQATLPLRQ